MSMTTILGWISIAAGILAWVIVPQGADGGVGIAVIGTLVGLVQLSMTMSRKNPSMVLGLIGTGLSVVILLMSQG